VANETSEPIKTISSREVYRNAWTRVREDVIERSNGERGVYGVIDKDPACIVIPLERTNNGEFLWLVRQFRYTVGAAYYELPQGGWERPDVNAVEMANGELREETGLRAERMTELATLWIGYGVMRQSQHVFLAEGLTEGEHDRDPGEQDMTVHRVGVEEFEAMLLDGRVMDNCSAAAWGVYRVWRDRQGRTPLPPLKTLNLCFQCLTATIIHLTQI
jgi:8-oxo-dGTP pyrophosphatase MutT (NUDIX family)